MKFAKYTFLAAGIYGLIALIPQYFLESRVAATTPLSHPEFFYGFIGVAAAFRIVFLIISTDVLRYRLMIIPSIVEKFSFVIAVSILCLNGRTLGGILIGASIDLLLGVLFTAAWFATAGVDLKIQSTS